MDIIGYALMALSASAIGAMGGLGGAILLVPVLVLTGMPAIEAAPLGLISVAAGSIAAAPQQLRDRQVNHRLGVVTELAGASGAVVGATLAGIASDRLLTYVLATVAVLAATAMLRPRRTDAMVSLEGVAVGERVGRLSGVVPAAYGPVGYTVKRLPLGMGMMVVAGLIAGTAGASGGFIKTPATSEVMGVPARVAAATTTFTVGITSSAALVVIALDGRIDPRNSCAVIAGSLVGGVIGARMQSRLGDVAIRKVLGVLMLSVATILVVRA